MLDFIDYICGSDFISTVRKYVDPLPIIGRFDPNWESSADEFKKEKEKIDQDFYPTIFQIFNALGAIGVADLAKLATQDDKELCQYLTLESI